MRYLQDTAFHRGWVALWLFLLGATLGTMLDALYVYTGVERYPLIEMILVTAGVFSYIHPDIFGVPYWLPCIYACASLAVGDLGRSLMSLHTRAATL